MEVRQLVGWGARAVALASLVALVPASAALASAPRSWSHGIDRQPVPAVGAGMDHAAHMAAIDTNKLHYLAPSPGPEKDLPIPVPPEVAVAENGKYGPIGVADVDLVVKVRLAGLWERPAGEMAAAKGKNPRVREIGKMIAEQHAVLDELDVRAAKRLGIQLPTEPMENQKHWLEEMKDAEGDEFDGIFVDRLRKAHGQVFATIAFVRAGTRNDLVRELAQQSNQFVGTHLTLLENTNLVDWQHMPLPPEPVTTPVANAGYIRSGVDPTVLWAVLGAALVAGAITTLRVIRPR